MSTESSLQHRRRMKDEQYMREYLRRYFFLLDSQAKRQLPWLALAFLFSSILDALSISMLGFFLAIVIAPTRIFSFSVSSNTLIVESGLFIVSLFIVKAFLGCLLQRKIVSFSQRLGMRLKTRLLQLYQHAPYTFHLINNSACLIDKVHVQVDCFVARGVQPALSLLSNVVLLCAIIITLSVLHPIVTLVLAVSLACFAVLYDRVMKRHITYVSKHAVRGSASIVKLISQTVLGLKEIRILGKESYFLHQFRDMAKRHCDATERNMLLQSLPRYIVESFMVSFVIGLCFVELARGVPLINLIPLLGVLAAAGARLLPVVSQCMANVHQLRYATASMHVLYEDIVLLQSAKNEEVSTECGPFNYSLSLVNASYQYPGTHQKVLNQLNLTIKKGTSVGIVGVSGAGKSTLIHVLLGLLVLDEGEVQVDDAPINNHRAWLNNIAYIPQTIFLLDDSFRRNIAMGEEDAAIDDKRIVEALKMAQLLRFVEDLPDGLNTMIGENGIRLSGGQRQRVALARAFYHERNIIIMDEATSALDHATEADVVNALRVLHGQKTFIVIAHRLTTLAHCDVIFKIEQGRVVKEKSRNYLR